MAFFILWITKAGDTKWLTKKRKKLTSPNTERQAFVTIRTVFCIAVGALVFYLGYNHVPPPSPRLESRYDRLVYTVEWQIVSLSTLWLGMFKVLSIRWNTAAIDPVYGKAEHLLEVPQRYVQNTVEQLLLHCISQLVLCQYLKPESMQVVPILVLMFAVGRVIYFIGYHIAPKHRVYGFVFTAVPSFCVYVYCLYRFLFG